MSASVKAYFALKMIGDDIDAPHMQRAREAILSRGGAINSNVFTRALLALFGILRWQSVPVMPVEIMLLPRWFPFHIAKISYWGRTVVVPLLVLQSLRPRAKNPRGVTIDELFLQPPQTVGPPHKAPHQKWTWFSAFRLIDMVLRPLDRHAPKTMRQRAIQRAVDFVSERLNGEDGLGAIFPAMANACLMFDVLGDPAKAKIARDSLDKLLVIKDDEAYCQPCVSPVWDTALVAQTLLEVGSAEANERARCGLEWLKPLQVLDVEGDWIARRPGLRPGGWAFQYANPHYPDLDDTAVVVMAMDRARRAAGAGDEFDPAIDRAGEWIRGMQSSNGGWAAFDVDNTYDYLNNIPFADHGALIDPPTEDVGARCVSMLAQLGETPENSEAVRRGVDYLLGTQLAGWKLVRPLGHELHLRHLVGAVRAQCLRAGPRASGNAQGGRMADRDPERGRRLGRGWFKLQARLSRLRAGADDRLADRLGAARLDGVRRSRSPAVARGIRYLADTQSADGFWNEERFTATGFPRVFYLRYHGYRKFFPLWALARYRN